MGHTFLTFKQTSSSVDVIVIYLRKKITIEDYANVHNSIPFNNENYNLNDA